MKSRVIGIVLIVLLLLSSGISYGAVDLSKAYRIDEGVTLHLPDNWTEIPKEQLDEMTRLITANLGVAAPKYDFGFQLEGTEYFSYPYMIVTINNTGRINESELSNIKRIEKELGRAFDSAEQELDSLVENVNMGEQVYDEDGKRLISKAKTDVAGVGSVFMVLDLQLTGRGYIQFMLYCEESQYDKYDEIFSHIINGVEITGDALYSGAGASKTGTVSGGTATDDGADITAGSDTAGSEQGSVSYSGRDKNPKKTTGISPVLIAAGILVIGLILLIIMRSRSSGTDSRNTRQSGYSDWFCPKCRHGNPASTSVCQNCNHSIV
jgi:hypothetical protein